MSEKVSQGLELVKAGANVLSQFYQDLAQPSVKALGQALATVFELCPNSLLSLQLWSEKRKLNFAKRLNEYKEKLEQIPVDKRCEVDTQIGTPIVEKLTYTTNDEIADLFTTLLANASNTDTVNQAHPSFVDIISRISPDEAKIIKYFSKNSILCYCDINAHSKTKGYDTLHSHVTILTNRIQLLYPQNERAYLFNLISLGIVSDESPTYRIDQTEYDEIETIYNVHKLETDLVPTHFKKIESMHSYYQITPLGRLFVTACIK